MKSDDASAQNRRGRPATGTNPAIGVRLPPELIEALDCWRRNQSDLPGRPEAIRRLIERGLAASEPEVILNRQADSTGAAPSLDSEPGGTAPSDTTAAGQSAAKPGSAYIETHQLRAMRE